MTKPKTRGERWLAEVEEAYRLTSPAERLLAEEIAATIDAVDQATSASEKRLQRTLLDRLLGHLQLPDDTGERMKTGKAMRAKRASDARWRRERAAS